MNTVVLYSGLPTSRITIKSDASKLPSCASSSLPWRLVWKQTSEAEDGPLTQDCPSLRLRKSPKVPSSSFVLSTQFSYLLLSTRRSKRQSSTRPQMLPFVSSSCMRHAQGFHSSYAARSLAASAVPVYAKVVMRESISPPPCRNAVCL